MNRFVGFKQTRRAVSRFTFLGSITRVIFHKQLKVVLLSYLSKIILINQPIIIMAKAPQKAGIKPET